METRFRGCDLGSATRRALFGGWETTDLAGFHCSHAGIGVIVTFIIRANPDGSVRPFESRLCPAVYILLLLCHGSALPLDFSYLLHLNNYCSRTLPHTLPFRHGPTSRCTYSLTRLWGRLLTDSCPAVSYCHSARARRTRL